ncbi:MAG: acetate--CoA ligase family protein [Acidobacteriota bacterium]
MKIRNPTVGLDAIFRPRSIAVIGASRKPMSLGREVLRNLIQFEYQGKVFPVNPRAAVLHSMKCYPRITEIPDPVDLAVIAVPRDRVLRVIGDCRRKGVRGLVVITAGFQEAGDPGRRLGNRLRSAVQDAGIRMIGPNCMGVINTDPGVRLNATFAATPPLPGGVGFLSQSGALGEVILAEARRIGLGVSMFASLGNQTDVEANHLLEYWENDPSVRVILMYLESFGNPERFTRIAKRLSRKKPVIAVKAGRTAEGARAAFSHTGALASADQATASLLEQCGVQRASSIGDMFDIASCLSTQETPRGNRVAILTNAGGPAILTTDACIGLDLQVAPLGPSTLAALQKAVPRESSLRNPVDLLASAGPDEYSAALQILLKDPAVDAVIAIFVSPIVIDSLEVAARISERARRTRKPVLACLMGRLKGREAVEHLRNSGVPVYSFPESAARALAGLVQYRRHRTRPVGRIVKYRVDRLGARRVLEKARRSGRRVLNAEDNLKIFSAYGFRFPAFREVASDAAAVAAATTIGYPGVLKISLPELIHKSDVGGVLADLRNGDEVARGFRSLHRKFPGGNFRARVEKRIPAAREVILGMVQDPNYGPLVMFGTGGVYTEILGDVIFRIHPITDREAAEMVDRIRGLTRGRDRAGEGKRALIQGLLRFSQLVGDLPGIQQMEINPLILAKGGTTCFAADVRVQLSPDF